MKFQKTRPATVVIMIFIMRHVIQIILRVVERAHKRFVRGMHHNLLFRYVYCTV